MIADPLHPPAPNTELPLAPLLVRAGLPRRLAAILYDSLLLLGVLFVASALAMALEVAVWGKQTVMLHAPLRGNPLFSTYLLLVCFLFYGGFWIHGGQTLGMRAWRIQVRRHDGNGIGWWQALARFLIGGLWLAPLLYLHRMLGTTALSLSAGLLSLIVIQALRLPDQVSATELIMLPKRADRSTQAMQGQEPSPQKKQGRQNSA